jgi:hypothetical protein
MKQPTLIDILEKMSEHLATIPVASDCSLSHGYESAEEFMADVAEAYDRGYAQIEDADGELFDIIDEVTISRVNPIDEDEPETVEELYEDTCDEEPEPETGTPMAKWQAAQLKILDVINNTLDSTEPITPQQAETILTLAAARETIIRDKY